MGYQVVEARREGSYTQEKFLVLNSEVVIDQHKVLNSELLMLEGNEYITIKDIDKIELESRK